MQPQPNGISAARANLALEYPMSLGVFDTYDEAQHAIDYLSDHEFPVENVLVVGTDLKQMERVTGRLTRGKVAAGGALSGAWLGFFVGIIFELFNQTGFAMVRVLMTVAFGAIFGLVWVLVGYQLTGGRRDFTSVTQVVATRYEVLVEHRFIARARELLAQQDPMRAAQEEVRRAQEEQRALAEQAPADPPQPDQGGSGAAQPERP